MNLSTNQRYSEIENAYALHRAWHIISLEPRPDDEIEAMVWETCLRKLKYKRDQMIKQALNGLDPNTAEAKIFDND